MSLADQFMADATAGTGAVAPAAAPTIAQQFMADAQAGGKLAASQATAQQAQASQDSALASSLSAGGASPDTLSQLGQIAQGGMHGIGSMFNNAANFVERQAARAGIFPQTAANDTAIQARADQQFSQNASPGAKAASVVAPMLLPMSDAMAPGNALRAGITALPRMGGTAGGLLGAAAGNALNGGLMATGAPMDPNQPSGPQDMQHVGMGVGLGVALPAAFGAARTIGSNIYDAARPLLNPRDYVGEQFANQVGDQAENAASAIRGAQTFVPGSMPTTAQTVQTPLFVATEKAQSNANPDFKIALAERNADQNAARWQSLMGIAQTPEALQAAQDARQAAAQPLYDAAHQQTANVGKGFINFAQRPAVQQAMQNADQLARNEGVQLTWPTPQNRAISGQALDYTNRALGDMIDAAQRAGNNQQARALNDAQSYLKSWTQTYVPGVRQAAQKYAEMSIPVNTMEAGQQIANGIGTGGMMPGQMGGLPQITLNGYRGALTKAMKGAPYGIDASALNSLQGIGQDLQRASVSNGLRSPGSDTAYNLAANGWLARNLYGQNFGGATGIGRALGAAGALATGHPMVGLGILGGGAKIGQMVGNRLNPQLNDLLLNPSGLLPYLDARAAGPVNLSQQALRTALGRQIYPALLGGATRGMGLINSGN